MSSQERRVPLKPLPGPKGTRRLDHVGTMLGVYGLGAMLGPYLSHAELMLSQDRRVPFKPLPRPKGTCRFWA